MIDVGEKERKSNEGYSDIVDIGLSKIFDEGAHYKIL